MTSLPARYPAPAFDVFNVYFERIYDPTMHVVFNFNGKIDDEVLQTATMRVIASNPYLRSRFAEVDDRPVWEEIPLDLCDRAFLMIHSDVGMTPPEIIPEPLDVRLGPQLRVTLYRHKDGDRVCVTCHHGFCDATGALTLGKELFASYRGITSDPDFSPSETGSYDRTTDRILALYSEEEQKMAVADEEPFVDLWRFPVVEKGRGNPRIAYRTLVPDRLIRMKEFGRRYGATVNDILISAFFLAFSKIRDDTFDNSAQRSILTSADMRRLLNVSVDLPPMNLSVAFEVMMSIEEGAELADIIGEVADITSKRKAGGLGPACIIFYEGILAGGMSSVRMFFDDLIRQYQISGQKNPVFSNLGIIDPGEYLPIPGKDRRALDLIDVQFLPCVCWPYGFLVVASTFNGRLTLMTAYEEGPYSTETVERFLEYLDEYLP